MQENYNGWTNYETWCVRTWMDEDDAGQQQRQDALNAIKNGEPTEITRACVAAALKQVFMDHSYNALTEDALTGVYGDLLEIALENVNWSEIAKNILDLPR